MLKGAIHIHSTYSDGELNLSQLRDALLAEGCSFACLTDHAEAFTPAKLQDYLREGEALSGDQFCFVAGLEYVCEKGMHVLGYGATALTQVKDPQAVIGHIEGWGGVVSGDAHGH